MSPLDSQFRADFVQLVWLIPALPLAAFLINGLLGRRWLGHRTGVIATVAVANQAEF